jgi:hypothetical protein
MYDIFLGKYPHIYPYHCFISGYSFFFVLLPWPMRSFNVYGNDPVTVGIRSLPIGFDTILRYDDFRLRRYGCYDTIRDPRCHGLGVGGIVIPASKKSQA